MDIAVIEASSWEEAENEIRTELKKIDTAYKEAKENAKKKKELEELNKEPF